MLSPRRPLMLLLALSTLLAGPAASAELRDHVATDGLREHVAKVARSLSPHLGGSMPAIDIEEKPSAHCRASSGRLAVSTGLLAVLESDAQLAMLLGTALADTDQARTGKAREQAADRAAFRGMRALVAAGWDGGQALNAWDRLGTTSSLATIGDGVHAVDGRSATRRKQAAARALRGSSMRIAPGSGHAIGEDAYRQGVLAHLTTWKLAKAAPPVAEPAPAPVSAPSASAPAPGDTTTSDAPELLVLYRRSGGFTGWSVELRIGENGSRWVSESRHRQEEGPRPAISPESLAQLRALVASVASKPPRMTTPEAKWLRDGQIRSVEVRTPTGWKSIALSDGMTLSDDDHRLVTLLEELTR